MKFEGTSANAASRQFGYSEKDKRERERRRKKSAAENRELDVRAHVASVIELRMLELKAEGRSTSFEAIAREMGEFGKQAVIRIVAKERPLEPGLIERLARALDLDPLRLLEPILPQTELTKAEVDKRLGLEMLAMARMVTALGQDAIKDRHVVDAVRAMGAIDDKAKRRQLAEMLLAVARDHERMTGSRRLLLGHQTRLPAAALDMRPVGEPPFRPVDKRPPRRAEEARRNDEQETCGVRQRISVEVEEGRPGGRLARRHGFGRR